MTDTEIEAATSGDALIKFSSSIVVKPEPLIDCPEGGSVSHRVHPRFHRKDSVMMQEDVEDESTTFSIHNAMEEHPSYQQSTDVPIKQEPPDADRKYLIPWSAVIAEDGQVTEEHGNLSHLDDGVELKQTGNIEKCTNTKVGKIKVENVKCESQEIHCYLPGMNIPKDPLPVALYVHQVEGMDIPGNAYTSVGNLERQLPVGNDRLRRHTKHMRKQSRTGEQTLANPPLIDKKIFKCSICDYRSVRNHNLVRHMRRHTAEKTFKCPLCDYRTAHNNQLVGHVKIRSHTGGKSLQCSVCDYRSASNSHFLVHIRTHTGEKPFKCSICNYRSVSNGHLVSHMRTHTGEKPFKCSVCGYRSRHERHTDERDLAIPPIMNAGHN